uniref:Interleukin n=1 Tax=Pundamilia nyererei TaxID=303518 RepID=A0A3B4EXY9_9CICH
MEHYFRTALWMLFLIGCFQAAPTINIKEEINFGRLHKNVKFEVTMCKREPGQNNNSSDCKMQEERSLNFADFLEELRTIIDRINSN